MYVLSDCIIFVFVLQAQGVVDLNTSNSSVFVASVVTLKESVSYKTFRKIGSKYVNANARVLLLDDDLYFDSSSRCMILAHTTTPLDGKVPISCICIIITQLFG